MAMTRDDFVEEIRANIRRSSTVLADSRIRLWLNWGQNLLSNWHTYEEMKKKYTGTTVASQPDYGFPTNMKDIQSMVINTGDSESRKLIHVPARSFDKIIPRKAQHDEGIPAWYVDYGVNFEVFKIPDDEYTFDLRCSLFPADFNTASADATYDVVSGLLRKDALLSALGTMYGFLSLRELEDATYWKEEYVTTMFQASILGDHVASDWEPIARGFGTGVGSNTAISSYLANPLINGV